MPRGQPEDREFYHVNIPIPKGIRNRLKAVAEKHRRSMRQQILLCLDACERLDAAGNVTDGVVEGADDPADVRTPSGASLTKDGGG